MLPDAYSPPCTFAGATKDGVTFAEALVDWAPCAWLGGNRGHPGGADHLGCGAVPGIGDDGYMLSPGLSVPGNAGKGVLAVCTPGTR